MESSLSFFSLPFVDSESTDLVLNIKNDSRVCGYDELHAGLPSHGGLLGSDDVLAQFLSPDEPLDEPDLNGPTTLHCEICRKKFDNAKKYYGHLRIHSKGNAWVCDKCPEQTFATKQHLMKHALAHAPLERVWRCPQCSLAFEALWRLQQHLFSTHLEYRPHKCDECEKTFHKKSDLNRHKNVHSNVKKFVCTECGMAFTDNCNLKRHMLCHTKEKPYCCSACGRRYKQLASMKRHSQKCRKRPASVGQPPAEPAVRQNHCRICGATFTYKSALVEHTVRHHGSGQSAPAAERQESLLHMERRAVDNIVDDILSAEDDYLTLARPALDLPLDLLRSLHPLHSMHDDLYPELGLDDLPPHIFSLNDVDTDRNGEILFDFADGRSQDRDIMSPLTQAPSFETTTTPAPVSVDECATIFESDVDLEASTNLAANLNQLIGENNVQYVSTEDDDTFIISLNSAIDAEQLTDMLNIGVELIENNNDNSASEEEKAPEVNNNAEVDSESIVIKIEKPVVDKQMVNNKESDAPKQKIKKCTLFICRTCSKVFKKKDNYKSHKATHEPALRAHGCWCGRRFSYRSSLTKHARAHAPPPPRRLPCARAACARTFAAPWMLKVHIERDHDKLTPFKCKHADCDKKFYKRSDLVKHERFHSGEKPFSCGVCARAFQQISHLRRHARALHPPPETSIDGVCGTSSKILPTSLL